MQDPHAILYPLFAMFLLVSLVLGLLVSLRAAAVLGGGIPMRFFQTLRGEGESEAMIKASRHYVNLFESPLLFYAVVILIYVTERADVPFVTVAWIYAAARYAHAVVHMTVNAVLLRAAVFAVSYGCLAYLWVRLFCKFLEA